MKCCDLVILSIASFSTLPLGVNGKCPAITDVPDTYEGRKVCAQFWHTQGHDQTGKVCNEECGQGYNILDEQDMTAPEGKSYPMGSIIVNPGCHFYGYTGENYKDHVVTYENLDNTGLIVPNIQVGNRFDSGSCAESALNG